MKKLLNRILSLVTATVMAVTAMPVAALASDYQGDTGGSLTIIQQVTVTFVDPMGATETRPADKGGVLPVAEWPSPSHEGYRLTGWYDGDTRVDALEAISGDMTLTAHWTRLFTIAYEDWNGDVLQRVQVEEGSAFTPDSYNGSTPAREGFRFTGWKRYSEGGWQSATIDSVQADDVVVAQYAALETCTLTIHYVYADTLEDAAEPYVMEVYKDFELTREVTSKTILGYICKTPTVVFDHQLISGSEDIFVYYEPSGETAYTVEYYNQNVDGESYTLIGTVGKTGTTGAMTAVTADEAKEQCATGFKLRTELSTCNKRIAADGSTVIQIYFDREIHYVLFDTADGDYVEPIAGRYGASVTMPDVTPARMGYIFKGWDKTVAEIAAADVTVTAQWEAETVSYYVVVWRENANDDGYTILGKLRRTGMTGTPAEYKTSWNLKDVDGVSIERATESGSKTETASYFTYSPTVTAEKNGNVVPAIKGDGSTIYNVYYTRDLFTIQFLVKSDDKNVAGRPFTLTLRDGTVQVENCTTFGTPVYSITAKYEENLHDKFPGNLTYEGQSSKLFYYGWEKFGSGSNSTTVTSTRKEMDVNLCNTARTGAYAHIQRYAVQFTGFSSYDDLYYLLEQLDGNYKEAGYYQHLPTTAPGNIQGGSMFNKKTSKNIKGFTLVGRAVFAVSTDTYSIYSDPANCIVSVPWEEGLTFNTISGIIQSGAWTCVKRDDVNNGSVTGSFTANNVSLWWYTRNRHTLTFLNGGDAESIAQVPFDLALNQYQADHTDPERPDGVGSDYTFEGWFYDETFTKPVAWDTDLMPDGDLILYAYWRKPTYPVTFDYKDEATPIVKQDVGKGDKAETLTTPTRDGYRFDYWYYLAADGSEQPFSFSMSINRPYAMFAHWTPTAVTYQAMYVYLKNGTESPVYDAEGNVLSMKPQGGLVGESVTLDARPGYDAKGKPLFAQVRSSSIKLQAVNAQNVVTFYYERADAVYYKVAYVDEGGNTLHPTTEAIATDNAFVTESAVNISGYTPVGAYQMTVALANETDPDNVVENIISFVYRKNPTGEYTVKYYLQNRDDNGYTCDENATQHRTDVSLGSMALAEILEYPGYDYMPAISKTSGTVYSSQGGSTLTLSVYYNRAYVSYTAKFVDRATGETLHDDVTGRARFGKTVTVYAENIVSYTLEDPNETSAEILVSAQAENNTHIFYYIQRDDLTYVVRFLDDEDQLIADSITVTKDDNGRYVMLGGTYDYTLQSAALVSNEITYHLTDNGGAVPYTKSVTVAEGQNNFIDFHFAENSYTLTYNANDGVNAPVDSNAYYADDTVELQDAGNMTYGTYRFEGWTADENALHQVYTTEAALDQVDIIREYTFVKPAQNGVVYAVWSNVSATLTYAVEDGVSYEGTLPSPVTEPRGTSITVDGGAGISRVGYTFAGWQLKDNTGALVQPVYGTGAGMAGTIAIEVNTTLYAVWSPISYTIGYQLTESSPAGVAWTNPNISITGYDVTSASLTLQAAAMTGYRFLGWYTDAAGTTLAGVPAIVTGEIGNRDFYAAFEAVPTQQVNVTGYTGVYDGEAHGVTLNDPDGELLDSDTITYSTDNRYTDATDGQSVTVTVKRNGTEIFSGSASVVITRRPVTVTMASAENLTYTGEEQQTAEPKYSVSAYSAEDGVGVLPGQTINVVPVGDKRTDAGSNAVSATVAISLGNHSVRDNYDVTVVEGRIAIAQAESKAEDTTASHVYDGAAAAFNQPVLTDKDGTPLTNVTMAWKWPEETAWRNEPLPTETDVKAMNRTTPESYVIDVQLTHANYAEKTVQATLTVTPAPVLLTADSRLDLPYTLDANGAAKVWEVTDAHWQVMENGAPKAGMAQDTLYAEDTVTYVLKGNTLNKVGTSTVGFASYAIANTDHAKNYTLTTADGQLSVVRGTDDATLTAAGLSKTYTATAYPLPDPSVSVKTEGSDMVDRTADYTFSYTVDGTPVSGKPEFTDAGTYTVVISAQSELFAAPEPQTVTVTIDPAALTLRSGSDSVVYNAQPHSVAVLDETSGLQASDHAVVESGLTLENNGSNTATDQGTYTVKINAASVQVLDGNGADVTRNYTVSTEAGTLTIAPAPLTVSAQSAYAAYDRLSHTLQVVATGLQGNDALTGYTLDPANATEVGAHVMTPSAAVIGNMTDNYAISYAAGTLTILDFTVTGVNTTYDADTHQVTTDIPADIADLYDVTYNGDATNPVFVDVTDTTVTVTLTPKDPTAGLPVLTHDAQVVIGARRVALDVNTIEKTYDGQAAQLIATLPAGAAASSSDAFVIMNTVTYTDRDSGDVYTTPVFTDATTRRVTVTASHHNYIIDPVNTTVNIGRRPVTVTVSPANASFLYNEDVHTMTVTWDHATATNNAGVLDGHDLTYSGTNLAVTDVTDGWLNATVDTVNIFGDAAHTVSVLSNYTVQTVPAKVQVNRADNLTLTLTPFDGVYDGAAHRVTVASVMDGDRSVDLDKFTWTYNDVADVSRTDAGTTQVTVIGTSVDGNYPQVKGTSHIAVAQRPVTLTIQSSRGNIYTGSAYTVTGNASAYDAVNGTGLLTGHTVSEVLVNAEQINVGDYTVTYDENATDIRAGGVSVKDNYAPTFLSGSLEIKPAASAAAVEPRVVTYNGGEQTFNAPAMTDDSGNALTATLQWRLNDTDDWQDGDLPVYVLPQSVLTGSNPGTVSDYADTPYAVQVKLSADNYDDAFATAYLTIKRKAMTISVTGQSFVYDAQPHSLAETVSGLVGNDSVTYDFATGYENTQTDVTDALGHSVRVDRATVTITGDGNNDCYAVTLVNAAIFVTAQPTQVATEPVVKTVDYNGGEQTFENPVLLDNDGNTVTEEVTYQYRANDGEGWSSTLPTRTDAADYTVQVRMTSANYQPLETVTRLVIRQLPVTFDAPVGSYPYTLDANGNPKVWTLDATQTALNAESRPLVAGHSLTAVTLDENASRSELGKNDVVNVTGGKIMNGEDDVTANYAITYTPGSIEIVAGTAETQITADGLRDYYKSSDYTLAAPTVSVRNEDGSAMLEHTADFTLSYQVTSNVFEGTQTSATLPHYTDAGVYTITISATSTRFAAPAPVTVVMEIMPRPITITAGSVDETTAFVYDGSEHTVAAYTVPEGALQGTDTLADADCVFAEGYGNTQIDVIDRAVTLTGVTLKNGRKDVTSNYDITLADGRMIVKQASIAGGLTLTGDTHVYDGGEHFATLSDTLRTTFGTFSLADAVKADGTPRFTVTYTATPEGGSEGAASADAPRFTNVTTQTVTAYVTDTTGNMTIAPATAQVVVTPRPVTVAVTSEDNIPYDGLGHTLTGYTAERAAMAEGIAIGNRGLVGSDDLTAVLHNAGPHTLPNVYDVTVDGAQMTAGSKDNYDIAYVPGTLTITQATGIGLTLTGFEGIYDGQRHGYTVTANVPEGTEYTYTVLEDNGDTHTLTAEELAGYVNQGEYPLTIRISSPCYSDTATKTAAVKIGKRPITVTSGNNSAAPFTFNGSAQSVTAAMLAADSTYALAAGDRIDLNGLTFAAGYENSNTNVCDRDVTLTGVTLRKDDADVSGNYAVTLRPGHIKIVASEARTAEPTEDTQVYDGVAKGFVQPVLMDGDIPVEGVTYMYSTDGESFSAVMPTYTDVKLADDGTVIPYEISVRMSQSNYTPCTVTAKLTISKAAITVTADDGEYPYALGSDGNAILRSVTTAKVTSGALYENAQPQYTFQNNTRSAFGSQSVLVTGTTLMAGDKDKTGNYQITYLPGTLSIIRGVDQTGIDVQGDTVVYDALPHSIPAPRVLVMSDEGAYIDRTEDFTLTYDVTYTDPSGNAITQNDLTAVSGTEAGSYAITVYAVSEKYAVPLPTTVVLIVQRRVVNIQSGSNADAPFTYNGKAQSVDADLSYTAEGADATDLVVTNLAGKQTVANITYAAGEENSNTDVTDRAVRVSSLNVMDGRKDKTSNYVFNITSGRIVINPLVIPAADIGLKDVEQVYDGNDYGLTLPETIRTSAGTLTVADVFGVAYTHQGNTTGDNPTFIDAAVYPVTVTLTDPKGNFKPEPATASVTILPRPLTIAYGEVSEDYDAAPHSVDRTVTGLVARDALTVTDVNREATNATRLPDDSFGALTVTAADYQLTDAIDTTIDRAGNYDVKVTDGSLEILPLPLTVTAGTATYIYNAVQQRVDTYTVRGQAVEGQTVTATLTGNTAIDVVSRQSVTVDTVRVTDENGGDMSRNYAVDTRPGSLTIDPAPLTLGVTTLNVVFDGAAHTPAGFVASGLQTGDTLAAYTLTNMPQTAVGTYRNVSFDRAATLLQGADGRNVTADYDITYTTGALTITQPAAAYTVEYYYDGVLAETAAYVGTAGDVVTTYATRPQVGYTFSRTEGVPLTLSRNAEENVIRVYYVTLVTPELTNLTDAAIPLAGNMASLNVGVAVE